MNTIRHVKGLRMFCQKIIPLVYGEEISYYETLCKVRDKLNEVIETVNTIYDVIWNDVNALLEEWGQEYDDKMVALENRVDGKIDAFTREMEAQLAENLRIVTELFNATRDYVDEEVRKQQDWVLGQIANLNVQVQTNLTALKKYVDVQDDRIYIYVDSEIAKLKAMIPELQNVQVNNPITGEKKQNLQKCLDYLTWVFRYYAYRALWLDREWFTAKQIDDFDLTAWQFDVYGMKMMHVDRRWHMRSPYTGEVQKNRDVIYQNHRFENVWAVMSDMYDMMKITADTFDNFSTGMSGIKVKMTAYYFDHYFGLWCSAEGWKNFGAFTADDWYKFQLTANVWNSIKPEAFLIDYGLKFPIYVLGPGDPFNKWVEKLSLSDQKIYSMAGNALFKTESESLMFERTFPLIDPYYI